MPQIDLFTGQEEPEEVEPPKEDLNKPVVFTMGTAAQGFWEELSRNTDIKRIVDVRSIPYSRNPQFTLKAFTEKVRSFGRDFLWSKNLGGKGIVPAQDRQAAIEKVKEGDCLVCMEENPGACHRKRLLQPLLEARGFRLVHLRPKE